MNTTFIANKMVKSPYVITANQTLRDAWDYMKACNIRHLPVYRDNAIVGIISERDLKAAMSLDKSDRLYVEDIMKTDLYLVPQITPLRKVVQYMADNKIGSALVVDPKDTLIGIFTTIDALYLLADLLEETELDDRILNETDYWPRGVSDSL